MKQLAKLAGVSVRTLHLYDEIGLLKPSVRTDAGYRLYEEKELLRLQQILFYKELDFPLKDIGDILDDPDFDIIGALETHRIALQTRKERIDSLLTTIDKTILHIKKGDIMLSHEELYQGLPKEKADAWRKEAADKWGNDKVERSEMQLLTMTKENLATLKTAFADNWQKLARMSQGITSNATPDAPAAGAAAIGQPESSNPKSPEAQEAIRLHYHHIRLFWGKPIEPSPQQKSNVPWSLDQKAFPSGSSEGPPLSEPSVLSAYKCLGEMYTQDDRYTLIDGKPNPAFAAFLHEAISYFVEQEEHEAPSPKY